jgi:hypothetical protein
MGGDGEPTGGRDAAAVLSWSSIDRWASPSANMPSLCAIDRFMGCTGTLSVTRAIRVDGLALGTYLGALDGRNGQ